jgi:hypothetical protein
MLTIRDTIQNHEQDQVQFLPQNWQNWLSFVEQRADGLHSRLWTPFGDFIRRHNIETLTIFQNELHLPDEVWRVGGLGDRHPTLRLDVRFDDLESLMRNADGAFERVLHWQRDSAVFGAFLNSDQTWNTMAFLLRPVRPFEQNLRIPIHETLRTWTDWDDEQTTKEKKKQQIDLTAESYGSSQRLGLWMHIPMNAQNRMKVGIFAAPWFMCSHPSIGCHEISLARSSQLPSHEHGSYSSKVGPTPNSISSTRLPVIREHRQHHVR